MEQHQKSEASLVRQNVNLLEFPIWSINKRDVRVTFEIETKNGVYKYRANPEVGVPDTTDIDILYYLLHLAQTNNTGEITTSFYSICKNAGFSRNSAMYKRIERSLDIWTGVSIKFNGNYYNAGTEKKHISKGFHILEYHIDKGERQQKSEINISLNGNFISSLKVVGLFDIIDINLFIGLKNPLSKRLYEYLPKHFADGKEKYNISDNLLFDKLRLNKQKYKSQIIRQFGSIIAALDHYNDSQDEHIFKFGYEQKRNSNTDFLCTFYKIEPEKIVYENRKQIEHKQEIDGIEIELQNKLLHYGLTEYQIKEFLNNTDIGIDGIKTGFEYFLKQLKDDKIHTNKAAYLSQSIMKGWGKKTPEEIEKEKKQVAIEAAKKRIKDNKNILKLLKEDVSKCFEYKIKQFIDTIENIEELEKECKSKLNSFERQMYNSSDMAKNMFINKYVRDNHIKETDNMIMKEIAIDKKISINKINKEVKKAEEVLKEYGVVYVDID